MGNQQWKELQVNLFSSKFLNLKRSLVSLVVLQNFGGDIVVSSDSDSDPAERMLEAHPVTASLNTWSSQHTGQRFGHDGTKACLIHDASIRFSFLFFFLMQFSLYLIADTRKGFVSDVHCQNTLCTNLESSSFNPRACTSHVYFFGSCNLIRSF